MAAAAVMAILCYISSNPSPQHWVVSGPVEAVARLDAQAAATGEVRRVAHAADGAIGFSRYEARPATRQSTLWPLIGAANRDGLVASRFEPVVPDCPSGERGDVGKPDTDLLLVIAGPAAAIARLRLPLGTTPSRRVALTSGGGGLAFALKDIDRTIYDALVQRAASGALPNAMLVLVRPAGAPPRDRGPRRIDNAH